MQTSYSMKRMRSAAAIWDRWLDFRPSIGVVALASFLLVILIGRIDHETGTALSLSILYFVPIAIASWFGNRNAGIGAAVFSALVWHLADYGSTPAGAASYVNLGVRLLSFVILAWLLAEVRTLNRKLKYGLDRKTASLEREQAERRRIEQDFETFFTLSQDLFCICDFEMRFQTVNPSWERITQRTGLDNQELVGLLHPGDVPSATICLEAIRKAGGSRRFTARFRCADGSFRTLAWTFTAAPERRLLFGVAHDLTESLKLERQILEVSDRECQRFGQDLHDGLCQRLKALAMIAEAARDSSSAETVFYKARAEKLAFELQRAIEEARNLARGLYPVHVDSGGLRSALEELAAGTRSLFGIDCRVAMDDGTDSYDNATAVHLYRIAQEAVGNAIRHGKARSILLALTQTDGRVQLAVRDDGGGFSPEISTAGMGIHTMRYRAGLIGAAFEIQSGENEGTTITCILNPL